MSGVIRYLKHRVLTRAEWRMETFGWRRGRMGNEQVGYCLVGAVRASSRWPHLFVLRPLIYRDLSRCVLGRVLLFPQFDLIQWSDTRVEFREIRTGLRCARGEEPDL